MPSSETSDVLHLFLRSDQGIKGAVSQKKKRKKEEDFRISLVERVYSGLLGENDPTRAELLHGKITLSNKLLQLHLRKDGLHLHCI